MSSASSAAPLGPPPLSQAERVVDTFVAPRKTFTDIRRSASWWLPFVLMVLSSAWRWCTWLTKNLAWKRWSRTRWRSRLNRQPSWTSCHPTSGPRKGTRGIVKFNRIFSLCRSPVVALIFAVIIAAVVAGHLQLRIWGGAEVQAVSGCHFVLLAARNPESAHRDSRGRAHPQRRSRRLHLPEPRVASNLGALVDPSSHVTLFHRNVARPVHHLDARAGGNRLCV